MPGALIEAVDLSRTFQIRRGPLGRPAELRAVDGVNLSIRRGEALGIVGESGCGKSTLGRVMVGLLEPSSGRVIFDGSPVATKGGRQGRAMRRRMQMIFQDPFGSLDPRRRTGAQIADGLRAHAVVPRAEITTEVARLMELVGLDPRDAGRLPHEFSGGQRQRIAVARALAPRPDFIVADEPVSALDVSIQAQVVNLLADLRGELGLALLFISHDLHVVRHLCERIVVMYLGKVVEEGASRTVFDSPAHPYSRALIEAAPSIARREPGAPLEGEPPNPANPPSGCPFRTRCSRALPRCAQAMPPLEPCGQDRCVACFNPLV